MRGLKKIVSPAPCALAAIVLLQAFPQFSNAACRGDVAALNAAISSGTSPINLSPNCTYLLTGTLTISSAIIINGNGATIDGGGSFRVFDVFSTGNLTLNSLTVTGGHSSGGNADGGGILNEIGATVTLNNSSVSGNTADNDGGGILNEIGATVTLNSSSVSGNTAGNDGGASTTSAAEP